MGEVGFTFVTKPAPISSGTYTGNGSSSKFISVGFTPAWVFVVNYNGIMGNSNGSSSGGMATTSMPSGYNGNISVKITNGGFYVHQDEGHYIRANSSGERYNYVCGT